MVAMLGVVFDIPGVDDAQPWRRYLALLLDALRATDRPDLPVAAPQFATLDEVIAASKRQADRAEERRSTTGSGE